MLTLPLLLLLGRQEPGSSNNTTTSQETPATKRYSSKRLKVQRQRDIRRERQQTPTHGPPKTKREKLALAMAKFWQQQTRRTAGMLHFGTMHDRTMAQFSECADNLEAVLANRGEPNIRTPDAWYWNVNDKYVLRYSHLWSNQGRRVGKQSSCCWVLDPEYYDKHQNSKEPNSNSETDKNHSSSPTWLMGQCRYEDMEFYATYHIDFDNFYQHTRAHYVKADSPPVTPPKFTSPSGSQYWEGPNGVYRCSDHWSNTCGRIATCWWTYAPESEVRRRTPWGVPQERLTGYCRYADFRLRLRSSSRPFLPGLQRFMAKNPKTRKIFRYRNRRSPGRVDVRRTLVNDRSLPQIMMEKKQNKKFKTSYDVTNSNNLLSAWLSVLAKWKSSFESWLWETALLERLLLLLRPIIPTSNDVPSLAASKPTPVAPP